MKTIEKKTPTNRVANCASFPGIVLVFALQIQHPKKHPSPRQTKEVGHAREMSNEYNLSSFRGNFPPTKPLFF